MKGRFLLLVAVCACHGALASGQPGLSREASQLTQLTRLAASNASFSVFSGFTDSARIVVRDSATWDETWRTLHRPFIPPPPVPPVNFSREMVIVAALGARPTEGYEIVFESAREDTSGIEVDVRVSEPARGCPVAAAVTQPVDLARIAATGRAIRFRQRNVVVPCGVR
jgi:hypothetical protein